MRGMSQQVDKAKGGGRRWFSFRLRTLLLFVLLVGVVLAPVAWKWHRHERQQAVVDWIIESVSDSIEPSG